MGDPDKALNKDTGEEASVSTTPVEETKASEEVKPEEGKVATEPKTEEIKTEEVPHKGYEARVQELNAKAKMAEERAKSLEQRLAELTSPVGPALNEQYTPQVTPGQEVDVEQYKQDVLKTADAMVNLRIRQSEAVNRINNEAHEAISKYPQLDPDSDTFDKELSDAVTESVEAHVRANPYSASVSSVVAKLMKPYQRAVTKGVGKETENIAKQVSQTAVRPTSIQPTEKSFKELSIEEMEKKLGVTS
jgi:hypothetical protein